MIDQQIINKLVNYIEKNNCNYLEITDVKTNVLKFDYFSNDVNELSNELSDYLTMFVDGAVNVRLTPDKKKKTLGQIFPVKPSIVVNGVDTKINNTNNLDLTVKYELLKKQIEFDKVIDEKNKQLLELNTIEDEDQRPIIKLMNSCISGLLANENFQKDPINTTIGYVSQIAGMFNSNHIIQQNQVAGVENGSIEKIKKILGNNQFDLIMDYLAKELENDKNGTILKIQKIFTS